MFKNISNDNNDDNDNDNDISYINPYIFYK